MNSYVANLRTVILFFKIILNLKQSKKYFDINIDLNYLDKQIKVGNYLNVGKSCFEYSFR